MEKNHSSKFQAVTPRRLTEEIANQIEELILNQELKVGETLPPERELAVQLQVSRNILREAISMLRQKGLLEVRSGSGIFVARPNEEFLQDIFNFFIRFSSSALLDLVEARLAIEVEIAGLAAQRASEEHCARLFGYIEEMEKSVINPDLYPDSYIEADIEFHETLAKAAGNLTLRLFLSSIRGALRENISTVLANIPEVVDESIKSHQQIARAVKQHDPEKACLAMREHLESIMRRIKEIEERKVASL